MKKIFEVEKNLNILTHININSKIFFCGSRILRSNLKTDSFSGFIAKALHNKYFSEEKKYNSVLNTCNYHQI